MIDGTTFSMPDTEANQAEYPQPTSQAEGLGFPILRAVALTSLATGMVMALATGPYAGKETGETALLRTLFDKLQRGDLVLADRYYGGWFMLALLRELGVEFVTRLHQLRDANFRRGKRLGKGDHIVTWAKPAKPEWLDQETYDRLPAQLQVREIEVRVNVSGVRTESLVVVTSLFDHKVYTRDAIADLYRRRWVVETNLSHLKRTMKMDVLRCETVAGVMKELTMFALVYNLVRVVMWEAARRQQVEVERISFVDALRWLSSAEPGEPLPELIVNPKRPNRIEPRVRKRRPKEYPLMKNPRGELRKELVGEAVGA